MLSLSAATRIYLAVGATDMRKSYNGLSALVENEIDQDPVSGHLFVFCNGARNRLKILLWDGSGLWVLAKRLEKGTFAWPEAKAKVLEMSFGEFAQLLAGLDLRAFQKRRWYRRSPRESVLHS
jgi:transposase